MAQASAVDLNRWRVKTTCQCLLFRCTRLYLPQNTPVLLAVISGIATLHQIVLRVWLDPCNPLSFKQLHTKKDKRGGARTLAL